MKYSRSGQVILLSTANQSVCPSWPRVPNCDSWPYFSLEENFDIVFGGASTRRGGLGCHVQGAQSFSMLCICSYSCVDVYCYYYYYVQRLYVHAKPTSPGIEQYIMPTLYTYVNLDTWTIVWLIATKFKNFIFLMLGFDFVYVSDIRIVVSLYDFCLLSIYFCYIIVNLRNLEYPM
jgi:hypothetical protein